MTESLENYLKTIYILNERLENVRSIDLANELSVSKASVSNAVKKLTTKGYIFMNEYNNLILTEIGLEYAEGIIEQHIVIEKYLIDILNVSEEIAHKDSCRMEHLISDETFNKLKINYEKVRKEKVDLDIKHSYTNKF